MVLSDAEVDLVVQLRRAQRAQGDMQPLVQVSAEPGSVSAKHKVANVEEEKKDGVVAVGKLQRTNVAELVAQKDDAAEWEPVTRSMF